MSSRDTYGPFRTNMTISSRRTHIRQNCTLFHLDILFRKNEIKDCYYLTNDTESNEAKLSFQKL